jgi:hypothetical protein
VSPLKSDYILLQNNTLYLEWRYPPMDASLLTLLLESLISSFGLRYVLLYVSFGTMIHPHVSGSSKGMPQLHCVSFGRCVTLSCAQSVTKYFVGYYDGVIFHRVVRDFLVQTGDRTGTGGGGESFYGGKYRLCFVKLHF